MAWSKARVLQELLRLSSDGIACSANDQSWLYRQTVEVFGSWEVGCRNAGLYPRNNLRKGGESEEARKFKLEQNKMTPRMWEFCRALVLEARNQL